MLDHLPPPPPRLGMNNPGDLESPATSSSLEGNDYSETIINYNRRERRRTPYSQWEISKGLSNLRESRSQIKSILMMLPNIYAGESTDNFGLW
jgi:hypothetical protein